MDQLLTYRRALVAPKTRAAFDAILDGQLPPAEQLVVLPIPQERYQNELFPLLNDMERVCGVGGADHSVEEIEQARLGNVIQFLKDFSTGSGGGNSGAVDRWLADWIDRAWGMCWQALHGGQGKVGGPAWKNPEGWSVFLVL